MQNSRFRNAKAQLSFFFGIIFTNLGLVFLVFLVSLEFLEKLKRTTKYRLYRKSITSAEGASECLKRKLELACEAARKLLMLIVTHFLPCSIFICCG